ncbi:hypothetical protein ASPZODRAFT_105806 [Penicilliopsis zonata CBS 506.65]|uniref:Isochorismatase-like domain-containing protein n=1 Tax=Penicilliopsis zonata CBS 506.65 TaxID=1073090 RepID=A0A1L9S4J1_9EURO|nr:hypothetical protein ASPZODRAFT_105806 [Penicilliopsis zonata CBS 506.65]OJJ42080.1 hypothetical protein ASPZODRAFT_105806 [Penicilliopsis zonata CBS 506.65]
MTSRRALFVIDIQNELIADPDTRIPTSERIIKASEEILNTAREALGLNSPRKSPQIIVFIQHEEFPPEGTMLRGSKPWELFFPPRPSQEYEILVAKSTANTFESNRDLAQRLRDDGITEIVAFGLQSEGCVEATCTGALASGFGVTVLSGAHSTYDKDGKKAAEIEREVELRLSTRGARVVPWEKEISAWLQ